MTKITNIQSKNYGYCKIINGEINECDDNEEVSLVSVKYVFVT